MDAERGVLAEEHDGVLVVTLNRPERMNAMDPAMRERLMAVLDEANREDAVRAIVVTGAGRGFCSGADLSGGAAAFTAGRDGDPYRDGGGRLAMQIYDSPKPLIGAVNGAAVGMGAGMLLPMDVRVAATDARFGFVYTRRAIAPESVSSWFLPRIVGIGVALEWMLTGRMIDATEALRAGLVSRVVEPDALLDTAVGLGREIADNTAPASVAATRQMLWRHLSATPLDAHLVESRVVPALALLPDAIEGVAAFRDRRAPRFTGSVIRDLPGSYPWFEEEDSP
jgi:enoyl-CoA hydratase/carnithine racemase